MHPDNIVDDADRIVVIEYTNYRQERKSYRVIPHSISFGRTEWHPQPQWMLAATDVDRNVHRTFAMANVHSWIPT
jgi:hypothetical protein